MVLTAKDAIARHVQWKITLQVAITREETLSEEEIDHIHHHKLCAIGRWLDSSSTAAIRTRIEYLDLMRDHINFHLRMTEVANLIAGRKFSEAARAMERDSAFEQASKVLAMAIMTVNRIVPISAPL